VLSSTSRARARSRALALTAVAVAAAALLVGGGATSPAAADQPPGEWVLWGRIDAIPAADRLAVDSTNFRLYSSAFDPASGDPALLTLYNTFAIVVDEVVEIGLAPQFTNESVNAETGLLYVPARGSGEVIVINSSRGVREATIGDPTWTPFGTTVDETTNTVYVADGNDGRVNPSGAVHVIDGATNAVTASIPTDDDLGYPSVSSEHGKLFVPVRDSDTVLVLDTGSNTVVAEVHGASPGSLTSPTMAIADDAHDRVIILNANTSGAPGGFATFTVLDAVTNAVLVTAVPLPADVVPSDRFAVDAQYGKLTVGGAQRGGAAVVLTYDLDSLAFLGATPIGSAVATDAVIDASRGSLFVASAGEGDSSGVTRYHWAAQLPPSPPPAPAPGAPPAPAAGSAVGGDRLPETGAGDAASLGVLAGLLAMAGVGTLALGRRGAPRAPARIDG
jgi:LPXTG-motif cell wall-anchored protein